MTFIRANVRGTDYSTSFDRVNNVLGLTLNSPATGKYTIRVSGYNVPQGPQPYALVLSGNIKAGSYRDELAVDLGAPSGLWDYDGITWGPLSGSSPVDICGWSGGLAIDFSNLGLGLWNHDGSRGRKSPL